MDRLVVLLHRARPRPQAGPRLPEGAAGEEWQVHGGGFYYIRKFLIAPAAMPEHLTWFKWESYSTWLSGAALLMVVYWAGAELYLIDPAKADLVVWQGIALSAAVIVAGWIGYDWLCRSPLKSRPTLVMLVLFGGTSLRPGCSTRFSPVERRCCISVR